MDKKIKSSINYSSKEMINAIDIVFTNENNPALYHYYEKDRLWEIVVSAISDEEFMKIAIFNNDFMHIAPTHTFSAYYLDNQVELTSFEKNSTGRFFKFIFQALGYNSSIRVYRKQHTIKYAKVFKK